MPWMLDTNVLIAASKANPVLCQQLECHAARDLLLSSVALAEIEYGIAKSAKREHNRRVFDAIVREFNVTSFGARAARHYGEIRAALERDGCLIGPNDMLIAAEALACDAVLVTDNTREFSRIQGLRLENWLRSRASCSVTNA